MGFFFFDVCGLGAGQKCALFAFCFVVLVMSCPLVCLCMIDWDGWLDWRPSVKSGLIDGS